MSENKKVADFQGKLIPKNKARRIEGHYYHEGVTCILMPDEKWYRTNTNKIVFDWEKSKWVFTSEAEKLIKGLVDDGSEGYFTASEENVQAYFKKDMFVRQYKVDLFDNQNAKSFGAVKPSWTKTNCRNEEVAAKYGYQESVYDGRFYRVEDCSAEELARLSQPGLPQDQRTTTYSLADDPAGQKKLEECYNANNLTIEKSILKLSKLVPYTFGVEYESSIGFVPPRVRNKLGLKNLKDGSISGVEYVTIPFSGAKGLQALKQICGELTKRCDTDNHCSVHIHFGNVRRDKLTIIALWRLATLIQDELLGYFPYSRTNSIRTDGKIYCKHLPNVKLDTGKLFTKSKDEFHKNLLDEFNKIYMFLNNNNPVGHRYDEKNVRVEKIGVLAGEKVKLWRTQKKIYCYSTKNKKHAITGHKWDRPQRYFWINFLPTFFSAAETIEVRPHEATMNFEKTAMWMLTCTAMLQYAKNNIKRCLTANSITVEEVLKDYLPETVAKHIMGYYMERQSTFKNSSGAYKDNWDKVEKAWVALDKNYIFNRTSIEDLL